MSDELSELRRQRDLLREACEMALGRLQIIMGDPATDHVRAQLSAALRKAKGEQ